MVEIEKTQKSFTFGVKLKLNGPVQAHGGDGVSAFEYHLAFLNVKSKLYQARDKATQGNKKTRQYFFEKQLKIALLYLFLFTHLDDIQYDPTPDAEAFLACFRSNDENEEPKRAMITQLYRDTCDSKERFLDPLRDLLVTFLKNLKSDHEPHDATLTLSLDRKILMDLDSIVTHHNFFQRDWEDNGGKAILQYVSIQDDTAGNGALCKLPVALSFKTMYYDFDDSSAETIQMSYVLDKMLMLPLIIQPFPFGGEPEDERLQHFLFPTKCLIFSYRDRDKALGTNTPRAFVYRLTYLLLAYLFLKLLLDEAIPLPQRRRVFLPLICLHTKSENVESDDTDTETFLHDFSKVLAHMLGEDYHASSQGIHLETLVPGRNDFEKKKHESQMVNALSSLYNALPHRFLVPNSIPLDKLAIIVVSSRKADASSQSPLASITVYGETIGMQRYGDHSIQAQTLTTFSENVRDSNLLVPPEVLIEQAHLCYQQGYKHFLYVARTPYSHTLRLPSDEAKTNLYFMNEATIRAMRQIGEGIKVYPIFYDKYWVIKKAQANDPYSLYIEDLRELSGIVSDKHKQTIVFLNVFNGLTVSGKKGAIEQRLYNGVISYGTLVNMYEDTTYYQYIWQDLLGERSPGSLSTSLLEYLELFHFLRNEKGYPDRFKLDPYSNIIGDKSVGKRSTLPHMLGKTRFNTLAFLTLVRSVLHAQQPERK